MTAYFREQGYVFEVHSEPGGGWSAANAAKEDG